MTELAKSKTTKKTDTMQTKLNFAKVSKKSSKQVQLCSDIVDLISEDAIKKSIVESDSFKKLIFNLDPTVVVPSRKTVDKDINISLLKCNEKTKTMMSNVTQVVTTADIWSRKRDSFMGMTAHWITDELKRESRALAVRHFLSPHTGKFRKFMSIYF